jgi:hypothetical protein
MTAAIPSDKDESIRRLVPALDLARHGWIICDHWDADRFAIGIAHPDDGRIAYISTWQKADGKFDLELETPSATDPLGYTTESALQDCTLAELTANIENHLPSRH